MPGNIVTKVTAVDSSREEVDRLLRGAKDEVHTMLEENRNVVEALRDACLTVTSWWARRSSTSSPRPGPWPATLDLGRPADLATGRRCFRESGERESIRDAIVAPAEAGATSLPGSAGSTPAKSCRDYYWVGALENVVPQFHVVGVPEVGVVATHVAGLPVPPMVALA